MSNHSISLMIILPQHITLAAVPRSSAVRSPSHPSASASVELQCRSAGDQVTSAEELIPSDRHCNSTEAEAEGCEGDRTALDRGTAASVICWGSMIINEMEWFDMEPPRVGIPFPGQPYYNSIPPVALIALKPVVSDPDENGVVSISYGFVQRPLPEPVFRGFAHSTSSTSSRACMHGRTSPNMTAGRLGRCC